MAQALALDELRGPGSWPNSGYPLPDELHRDSDDGPLMTSVVLDGVKARWRHCAGWSPCWPRASQDTSGPSWAATVIPLPGPWGFRLWRVGQTARFASLNEYENAV